MAIVLAADAQVHKVTLVTDEATGKVVGTKTQIYKTDANPKPVCKVCVIKGKFGCVSVGLRLGEDGVNLWVKYLADNTKPESTIEECIQILEKYRQERFANHADKETVEILLAGWDGDEPKLHYFNNSGNRPITGGIRAIGKGYATQLMALTNKNVRGSSLHVVVDAVQRSILDAHIADSTRIGQGVNVLIIRRNEKPNPMEIPYQTMDDLKNKFKTDKTTYNEMLQKKKEEKEAIRLRGSSSSKR
ncbi:hypothetical protein C5167_044413 [Papaver somniferum]|uniref:Uncharacterized protein n=2 Tax=Papaver somniferum TaxID=3469 RepID=A0A4Y7LB26_PAPSO|nr:hypothetical protein C5167_044413 [Papaver somniferum]